MLETNFLRVYDNFKLEFLRRLFGMVKERDGSLSAMEAFAVAIVHQTNGTTNIQVTDFLDLSQSNATY